MKRVGKFLGRTVLLLVAVWAVTLAYLHVWGLPGFLTRFVAEQLRRNGVAAQFGSIRLDLLRGLVARDAVLADASTPEHPLTQIDQLEFQWSWRRLLAGRNAVAGLRIANASIAIPTPPDEQGAERFTATEAYATFRFEDDGTIWVDELTGVYCGLRLHMAGRLRLRALPATTARRSEEQVARQFLFVTKAVRELNQIRARTPPQLDLDFTVDLGRPLASLARVRFYGRNISWRGLQVDTVAANFQMRNGAVEIRQFLVGIGDGEADVEGRYDIAMGRFDLHLTSTLNPAALAALTPPKTAAALSDLHVRDKPRIEARYSLSPETGSLPHLAGRVDARALSFRGVEFLEIRFAFDVQGPMVKLSEAVITMPEGQLTGQGEYDITRRSFAYELDSTIDPTMLLPVMTSGMRQIVEPACFTEPPHINAMVAGDFVSMDAFAYDAEVEADRCSYRGVPLEHASGKLRLRQNRLEVENLRLVRPEGEVHGPLMADFEHGRVQFNLGITANPSEVAPLLGEKAGRMMRPFRFGTRTTTEARGVVDFMDPAQTVWTAQVAGEGFSWWKLTSDWVESRLVLSNNALRIQDTKCRLYGGELHGTGEVLVGNPDAGYQYEFTAENCDVGKLMVDLRGPGRQVSGTLSGRVQATGRGENLKTMRGTGHLDIVDGVLWEAPLFGVFSRIANDIAPGAGMTKVTRAKADFTIEDGGFKTSDLEIAAGVFTINSRGRLGFDGTLDFRAQAQFLRSWPGINVISAVVGAIFEYKVGGSLADPSYRTTNLPKEIMPHD